MRLRTAVIAGTLGLLVVAGAAAATWPYWGGDDASEDDPTAETTNAPGAKTQHLRPTLLRRRHAQGEEEPAPDPDAELKATWDAAVALFKSGKPVEALTMLAQPRKQRPDWFAVPPRPAMLAEMERAALALLARAARSSSLEEARRLAAQLKDLIGDAHLASEIDDLLAAAKRRADAADLAVGADVIGKADLLSDKQALDRHLQRFADRGPAPKKPDWIDTQLAAVASSNAALAKEPDPLNIPDPAEAEKRRLDELDKLRQRNSLGLLDPIDGALAWLAIHQGDDGHFGNDAAAARCKALKHDPVCTSAGEPNPLGATGLAVLAFLDFRDQDVKRLFEPTLARGIAYLVSQQRPDGSFAPTNPPNAGPYAGYQAAIAMMALGQAAASTGDETLKDAVQRGIAFYAKHHGTMRGGYRYNLDQDGDLSVTGWYVQAVEAAEKSGCVVPPDMKSNIDTFLGYVTRTGRHNFAYTPDGSLSGSLSAVGMLSISILHPPLIDTFADDWRQYLYGGSPGNGNNTYALYYGVRVLLFLDGKLPDNWRKFLTVLAAKQKTAGASAGMTPLPEWPWQSVGPTAATAFATLTLEHSLYRR
jgi:hypothetical protein